MTRKQIQKLLDALKAIREEIPEKEFFLDPYIEITNEKKVAMYMDTPDPDEGNVLTNLTEEE